MHELRQLESPANKDSPSDYDTYSQPNFPPAHSPAMPVIVGFIIVLAVIAGTVGAFVSGSDEFKAPGTVARFVARAVAGNLGKNITGPGIVGVESGLPSGNATLTNMTGNKGYIYGTKGGGVRDSVPSVALVLAVGVVSPLWSHLIEFLALVTNA
ncbi:MAG: hypothetical protein M1821_003919 [Bathelium mastoideum]|nr:MAG: hypothetical protein M1821_003919 [Bathelium mastoideum]